MTHYMIDTHTLETEACLHIPAVAGPRIAVVPASWMSDRIMPDTYETGIALGAHVRSHWNRVSGILAATSFSTLAAR